jgi:hypothetical protein
MTLKFELLTFGTQSEKDTPGTLKATKMSVKK